MNLPRIARTLRPFLARRRVRHIALGLLFGAIVIPTLIAGNACAPVSLNYEPRPDSPGRRIYSRVPARAPVTTNKPPARPGTADTPRP